MPPRATLDKRQRLSMGLLLALSCGLGGAFLAAGHLAFGQAPAAATNVATPGDPGWPQFLGPTRDGIAPATGLLDAWPAEGPREVWRVKGGVGMSGLAVQGTTLVTMVQHDGQQWLLALDARTGKKIWETTLAPEYKNSMGNGPRGTPAIVGQQVFAFTGEGLLVAVRLTDGKLLWKHQVVEEQGGKEADYGMASSPLVVGNRVLVLSGTPQGTVSAYDTQTGKLAWVGGSSSVSYSSPTLLNIAGRPQVVVAAGDAIEGLDPDSGKILWSYPFVTDFQCNIATPLSVEGHVFVSAGENHGSALLKVTPRGTEFNVEEIWTSLGPKSVLRSEWQTAILLDGYLYGLDNVGGAGPITHLTCVEAATGKRMWQQPRFGKSNLIAADGKLFFSTMAGELVVVRANPRQFQEIGRATVLGQTRQSPSLAGGLLYLRDDQEIVCLDVRKL